MFCMLQMQVLSDVRTPMCELGAYMCTGGCTCVASDRYINAEDFVRAPNCRTGKGRHYFLRHAVRNDNRVCYCRYCKSPECRRCDKLRGDRRSFITFTTLLQTKSTHLEPDIYNKAPHQPCQISKYPMSHLRRMTMY